MREIDCLIAEKVMGWTDVGRHENCTACHGRSGHTEFVPHGLPPSYTHRQQVPHYTLDIAAAWQVVEKLRQKGVVNEHGASVILTAAGNLTQHGCYIVDWIWSIARRTNEVPPLGDSHLYGEAHADTLPLAISLAALRTKGIKVEVERAR